MDKVGEDDGALGGRRADQMARTPLDTAFDWVGAAPFALLAGDAESVAAAGLSSRLRRMGFRPEPASSDGGGLIAADSVRLSFGQLSVLAGSASPAMCAAAAPGAPGVHVAGSPPPADWDRRALAFVPERDWLQNGTSPAAGQRYYDRRFFEMLVLLIDTFDADYLFWSPARLWSRADAFRAAVAEMLDSGMPPVLHLIAFDADDTHTIRTRGLDHFTGQEMVTRLSPQIDRRAAVRRLARLALDMMINGPLATARQFPGLEPGETIYVTLDAASKWLTIDWGPDGA